MKTVIFLNDGLCKHTYEERWCYVRVCVDNDGFAGPSSRKTTVFISGPTEGMDFSWSVIVKSFNHIFSVNLVFMAPHNPPHTSFSACQLFPHAHTICEHFPLFFAHVLYSHHTFYGFQYLIMPCQYFGIYADFVVLYIFLYTSYL